MLGIPSTSSATIQPTVNLRNHFFATYVQDTWRLNNLTLNLGLRFEWEDGISEDNGEIVVDFDPSARLAISDLAEAAYARAPIAQLPAADFHVNGGSVYATAPGQDGTVWRPQALWMPRVSAVYKLGDKTVLKAGYGVYYDTLNAADFNHNNPGFSSTTTNTNSTNFGQTFLLGNPYNGELGISDPFPIRADGTRFDEPTGSSLGIDTIAGSAYTIQNQHHEHARQQRWRFAVQREVARNLSVEVAYDGSYSDRVELSVRQDYLPQQDLDSRQPERARCGHADTPDRKRDEPVYARELCGAQDDRPRAVSADVEQRLLHGDDDAAESPAAAVLADEQPELQQSAAWRGQGSFAAGQCEPSFFWWVYRQRGDVVQQQPGESYGRGGTDREPTLWWDDNNSRPFRLSGGAVYELPFGAGKPMLKDGGVLAAIAGGWQTGGTFEYQPGSVIVFNTNLFYYGNIGDIKKGDPEIALNADGTLDATKYWFNIDGFERDPTKTPTTFQTRAFPFQIDDLRGPGLTYVNLNFVRNFRLGGRRTFQARVDIQNLLNYAAFNNPITDPANTNFGKVTTAVALGGGDAVLQLRGAVHVLVGCGRCRRPEHRSLSRSSSECPCNQAIRESEGSHESAVGAGSVRGCDARNGSAGAGTWQSTRRERASLPPLRSAER